MKIRLKRHHECVREAIGLDPKQNCYWRCDPSSTISRTITTFTYDANFWEPVPEPNEERKTMIRIWKKNDHTCIRDVDKFANEPFPWRNHSRSAGTVTYYSSEAWEPVLTKVWKESRVVESTPNTLTFDDPYTRVPMKFEIPPHMRFRRSGNGFVIESEVPA